MKKLLCMLLLGITVSLGVINTHASTLEYSHNFDSTYIIFKGHDVVFNYESVNLKLVQINGNMNSNYTLYDHDVIITDDFVRIKSRYFYSVLKHDPNIKNIIFSYVFESDPFNERGSTHIYVGVLFVDMQIGKDVYTHSVDSRIKVSAPVWLREIRFITPMNLDTVRRLNTFKFDERRLLNNV